MTHAEQIRRLLNFSLAGKLSADERNAMLAGAEALEREAWRPISEAPRDGTHVLIGELCPDVLVSLDGKRESRFYQNVARYEGGNWQAWGQNFEPTHFMPLPQPPKEG